MVKMSMPNAWKHLNWVVGGLVLAFGSVPVAINLVCINLLSRSKDDSYVA